MRNHRFDRSHTSSFLPFSAKRCATSNLSLMDDLVDFIFQHRKWSLCSCISPGRWLPSSLVLLGDVLDKGAEDGHLLGEASLGAFLLLGTEGLAREVTDAVLKALLSSVKEILSGSLEVQEIPSVCLLGLLLLVHYFIIYNSTFS